MFRRDREEGPPWPEGPRERVGRSPSVQPVRFPSTSSPSACSRWTPARAVVRFNAGRSTRARSDASCSRTEAVKETTTASRAKPIASPRVLRRCPRVAAPRRAAAVRSAARAPRTPSALVFATVPRKSWAAAASRRRSVIASSFVAKATASVVSTVAAGAESDGPPLRGGRSVHLPASFSNQARAGCSSWLATEEESAHARSNDQDGLYMTVAQPCDGMLTWNFLPPMATT